MIVVAALSRLNRENPIKVNYHEKYRKMCTVSRKTHSELRNYCTMHTQQRVSVAKDIISIQQIYIFF